jgi:nucleotide-binding universal stress UspA family protein
MQRFQNILVGVELSSVDPRGGAELSSSSQEALRRAIWLAGRTHGNLTIFAALDLPPFVQALLQKQMEQTPHDLAEEAGEILERFVAEAKREGVQAHPKLAFGAPWREICAQVQSERHDLVIVGTRDVGHVSRILFGSTGMKLLRNCPCPVWVARPDANWERLNILIPSDLSDVSLEALRVAVNGGQFVDTQLHLVHALQGPVGPPAWYGRVPRQMVEEYIVVQRAEAKKKLHEQLARTGGRALQMGAHVHVIDGPPDEVILKAIDDLHIDLVVMGTSARSGIASLVLGNTTERLISHMKCSLLAVKPPGFQCPASVTAEPDVQRSTGFPSPSRSLQ